MAAFCFLGPISIMILRVALRLLPTEDRLVQGRKDFGLWWVYWRG